MKFLPWSLAALAIQGFQPLAVEAALPKYRIDAIAPVPQGVPHILGGMNDLGTIYGSVYDQPSGFSGTFIREKDQYRSLGTLGGRFSVPVDLNNRGQLIINAYGMNGGDGSAPFIYRDGRVNPIPLPAGAIAGSATVQDINDAGQILGWARTSGTAGAYFIHDSRGSRFLDTGTLPSARLAVLNDKGEIFSVV